MPAHSYSRLATFATAAVIFAVVARDGVADSVDYSRNIQPILTQHCVKCHGAEGTVEGGLDLTNRRTAFLRGDSGERAITPGDARSSELWLRIASHDDDQRMPPEGEPLSPQQIDLLETWIDHGANWPEEPKDIHWAYARPTLPTVPAIETEWSRNAIDRFVLQRLTEHQLTASPEADPARLLRRLYLDLIGLPPSVDDVNRFVSDPSNTNYLAEVDRLLASPRYGEKWSRHWLDLARYSDSNGYQADQIREMWAFRDWVIDAINDDMPYDQFTIEQLAGDLLPHPTLQQKIATGFHRATTCNVEAGVDPEGNRTDQIIDRVNTTGTTWLGTTLECAQCHNHKFDPISQQEYYELFAFFNNTPIEVEQEKENSVQFNFYGPKLKLPDASNKQHRRIELQAQLDQLTAEIANKKKQQEHNTGKSDELKSLQTQKTKVAKMLAKHAPTTTLVMQEMKNARETTMFVRGNFLSPGAKVRPNVPRSLNKFPDQSTRNRLGLAKWLVAPKNPLTARVAVNRWWDEIFGRGIVSTVGDFGTQGSPPTHPKLLDWLAIQLQANNWSMKSIHRLIVTSSTYRQSSRTRGQQSKLDPENRWLSRGPRHRLPAELIRDNALAISGLLIQQMHGPPVYPPQPAGLWRQTGRNEPVFDTSTQADRFRRGTYVVWRRAAPYPTFVTFDAPDRMTCVASRPQTNTPLQALALLNDQAYAETAKAMAARVILATHGRDLSSQLEFAVKLAVARPPTQREIEILSRLYQEEFDSLRQNQPRTLELLKDVSTLHVEIPEDKTNWAAWFGVCNAILNLDEAISK